jgi:tRNA(fMet)-specific endonuclease VapC
MHPRLPAPRKGHAYDVAISSIVTAELWTGVMKSRLLQRNEPALGEFPAFVDVLDWPTKAATTYGEIRAKLQVKGHPIGAMDLLIAAHAVHERGTIVTRNRDEFARVDGLKVES